VQQQNQADAPGREVAHCDPNGIDLSWGRGRDLHTSRFRRRNGNGFLFWRSSLFALGDLVSCLVGRRPARERARAAGPNRVRTPVALGTGQHDGGSVGQRDVVPTLVCH
jgi:hypothetical protein